MRHSKHGRGSDRLIIGGVTMDPRVITRTELDSHANMPVFGKKCLLLSPVGKKSAPVAAFSPTLEPMKIPIVDVCINWIDLQTDKAHFLVFKDALYVEQMEHNLIPPFLLREAGWIVNEVARIHCHDLVTEYSHCILHETKEIRIPLGLHGVFSYFPTMKPIMGEFALTTQEFKHDMTPIHYDWNPNVDDFAKAEDSYLDWQGRLTSSNQRLNPHRNLNMLDVSSTSQGWFKSEDSSVDLTGIARDNQARLVQAGNRLLQEPLSDSDLTMNGFASSSAVNLLPELDSEHAPWLGNDDFQLSAQLEAEASIIEMALASDTSVWNSDYLFSSDELSDENYLADVECVTSNSISTEEDAWNSDDNEVHVSSVSASNTALDRSRRLAKAWRIDADTATKTLQANTMNDLGTTIIH